MADACLQATEGEVMENWCRLTASSTVTLFSGPLLECSPENTPVSPDSQSLRASSHRGLPASPPCSRLATAPLAGRGGGGAGGRRSGRSEAEGLINKKRTENLHRSVASPLGAWRSLLPVGHAFGPKHRTPAPVFAGEEARRWGAGDGREHWEGGRCRRRAARALRESRPAPHKPAPAPARTQGSAPESLGDQGESTLTCTGRTWRTLPTRRGCSRRLPRRPAPPPHWPPRRRRAGAGCGSDRPGCVALAPRSAPSLADWRRASRCWAATEELSEPRSRGWEFLAASQTVTHSHEAPKCTSATA